MNHEEFSRAADYWKKKDAGGRKMDAGPLKAAAEAYIEANNTCALATGGGAGIRCTPIEYTWHDGAFWMFSEGGLKFAGLEADPHVALAIFGRYTGFAEVRGMQVCGTASFPAPDSGEYLRAAAFRKIPPEALRKSGHPMHLIKVVPETIDFLNSDFGKQGFSVRQHLACR